MAQVSTLVKNVRYANWSLSVFLIPKWCPTPTPHGVLLSVIGRLASIGRLTSIGRLASKETLPQKPQIQSSALLTIVMGVIVVVPLMDVFRMVVMELPLRVGMINTDGR